MKRRKGFALAAAIVAIVLIGVLISGVVFSSAQETHATGAQAIDQKVFAYTEGITTQAAALSPCPECDVMGVGSVIIRNPAPSPPLESTVFITRLDSAVFLVTGEGRMTRSGATILRRRLSIAVKVTRDSVGFSTSSPIAGDAWAVAWPM